MIKQICFLLLTLAAHATDLRVDRGHYWMDWPTNSEVVLQGRDLQLQWDWPETIGSNAIHFRLYMKPTPPTNSTPLPPMPPGAQTPPAPQPNTMLLDGSEIIWSTFIRTNGAFNFTGTVDAALPWGTNALRLTVYMPAIDFETVPSNTLIVRVLKNTGAPVGGQLRIGQWENFLALEFTNSLSYAERIEFAPQKTAAKTYLLVDPNSAETSGFWFTTNTPPLTPPAD